MSAWIALNTIFPFLVQPQLTTAPAYVQLNTSVGTHRLHIALKQLIHAIGEVEAVLEEMRAEHDALALHIFVSRSQYRHAPDTKSGKRGETSALISFRQALNVGFRGDLAEWERLLGAAPKR